MARLGLKLTASMEWHWLLQDGTRRELTLSFLVEMAEPASWSSLLRWEDIGLKKLASSWVPLPLPRHGLLQCCFNRACVLHGSIAGEVCWHVQQPVVLLSPFWATLLLGWTGLFHPCRMCCVTSATCRELWS